MARDPDTIEREIERTREALASTMDELGARANPQRLADTAKAGVRDTLEKPKVKFPLIGAGVVIAVLLVRKLLR